MIPFDPWSPMDQWYGAWRMCVANSHHSQEDSVYYSLQAMNCQMNYECYAAQEIVQARKGNLNDSR